MPVISGNTENLSASVKHTKAKAAVSSAFYICIKNVQNRACDPEHFSYEAFFFLTFEACPFP